MINILDYKKDIRFIGNRIVAKHKSERLKDKEDIIQLCYVRALALAKTYKDGKATFKTYLRNYLEHQVEREYNTFKSYNMISARVFDQTKQYYNNTSTLTDIQKQALSNYFDNRLVVHMDNVSLQNCNGIIYKLDDAIDTQQTINRLYNKVPNRWKDLFRQYYIEQQSAAQIADNEGVTKQAVYKKLNKIIQYLSNGVKNV